MSGRSLYLECETGISGDMTVAALLDLGADRQVLEKVLAGIPADGFSIKVSRVKKAGLDLCDFDVILDSEHENHDHDMNYLYGSDHHHDSDHHYEHGHGICLWLCNFSVHPVGGCLSALVIGRFMPSELSAVLAHTSTPYLSAIYLAASMWSKCWWVSSTHFKWRSLSARNLSTAARSRSSHIPGSIIIASLLLPFHKM